MRLFVPTNFDPELPRSLAEAAGRITFYGQSAREPFGGGRPGLFLPDPDDEALAAHFRLCRSLGFRVSYLFNAACTEGLEYRGDGNRALRARLRQLADWGVEEVTVSIPQLARIIRQETPHLTINAGLFARISDHRTARRWVEAGANKLTLFLNLNRDFAAIRRIRAETEARLELVATLSCLSGCIDSPHCANLLAHASRDPSRGGPVPTVITCYRRKLENPIELVRSGWIRPEDLDAYAAAGIDEIKLTERTDSTATLQRKVRAYLAGHYEGNFFDLLTLHPRRPAPPAGEGPRRRLDRQGLYAQAGRLQTLGALPEIFLDNRDLDGFLEYFQRGACAGDCDACGHCRKFAERIHIRGGEAAREALAQIQDRLDHGNP